MKLRTQLVALCAIALTACGAVDSMRHGLAHSKAIFTALEKSLGLKNFVGFNWANGSLDSVTVTFEGLPHDRTLDAIAAEAKQHIQAEFKQRPKQISIAFAMRS